MTRVRVRFVGRVQGVGFRATCRELARGRAVTGWVRNETDGSVLMEAQGDATAVEGLLTAIHERMRRQIEHADRGSVNATTGETSFVIA